MSTILKLNLRISPYAGISFHSEWLYYQVINQNFIPDFSVSLCLPDGKHQDWASSEPWLGPSLWGAFQWLPGPTVILLRKTVKELMGNKETYWFPQAHGTLSHAWAWEREAGSRRRKRAGHVQSCLLLAGGYGKAQNSLLSLIFPICKRGITGTSSHGGQKDEISLFL